MGEKESRRPLCLYEELTVKKSPFLAYCRKLVKMGDEFLIQHPSKFHEQARELLIKAKLHEIYNYSEIVENSFQNNFNHEQNYKSFEFSDLPITVARGEHCFIDLYFWRRNPTTIYNHHFQGAFQCLSGKNIDSIYKFKKTRKLTPLHSLGELLEIQTREVAVGEVEPIDLLDNFIHQNHHHGELTVNLCFRTPDYPGKNLANFLYTGLRYEKDQLGQARARRLYEFLQIDDLNPAKLNITLSDAFNFILSTHGLSTSHPRFHKLKKYLLDKIKNETGINLLKLLSIHDLKLDEIQSNYE